MKPRADFHKLLHAANADFPLGRFGDSAENFEECALPAPLRPMMPTTATGTSKETSLSRPKVSVLMRMPREPLEPLQRGASGLHYRFTKSLVPLFTETDLIPRFGDSVDNNGRCTHGILDDVRKPLDAAEAEHSNDEQNRTHTTRCRLAPSETAHSVERSGSH